jgi:DNA-binding CsgD family transcriptional regulator
VGPERKCWLKAPLKENTNGITVSGKVSATLDESDTARAVFEGPVLISYAQQPGFAPDMGGVSGALSVREDPVPLARYRASLARGGEPAALTDRQRDVWQLIMQGLSNKEIALALNIAHGTVKIHVAGLFRKLGVHRRAAVAAAGVQFLTKAT